METSRELCEIMAPTIAAIEGALADFARELSLAAETLVAHVAGPLEGMYLAIYDRYREAGTPYGDTHEGLRRWLREMRR